MQHSSTSSTTTSPTSSLPPPHLPPSQQQQPQQQQQQQHCFTIEWTIDNIHRVIHRALFPLTAQHAKWNHSLYSPMFTSPTAPHTTFQLELCPGGEDEHCVEFVSIFLYLHRCQWLCGGDGDSDDDDAIMVQYRVYIRDADGSKRNVEENQRTFAIGEGWGWREFILRNILIDPKNRLLVTTKDSDDDDTEEDEDDDEEDGDENDEPENASLTICAEVTVIEPKRKSSSEEIQKDQIEKEEEEEVEEEEEEEKDEEEEEAEEEEPQPEAVIKQEKLTTAPTTSRLPIQLPEYKPRHANNQDLYQDTNHTMIWNPIDDGLVTNRKGYWERIKGKY